MSLAYNICHAFNELEHFNVRHNTILCVPLELIVDIFKEKNKKIRIYMKSYGDFQIVIYFRIISAISVFGCVLPVLR